MTVTVDEFRAVLAEAVVDEKRRLVRAVLDGARVWRKGSERPAPEPLEPWQEAWVERLGGESHPLADRVEVMYRTLVW